MKRRHFIRSATAATAASLGAAVQAAEDERGKADRPNLMIIHCDELNFRTIACYRDTLPPEQALMWGPKMIIDTPHIDRLAREGAICTKHYAATPVCSPSRSTFLSGQYSHNTPVVNNNERLSDDVVTFAELLRRTGYKTGYAGKWHLDGHGKPQWEPKRNFGFEDNRYMFNRGHWKQFEDTPAGPRVKAREKNDKPSYSVKGADEESFATDWLATKAIDFIKEHKDQPWCYMLSIPDPHGPDTVREPYASMYDDKHCQKPRTYGKPGKDVPTWAKSAAKCGYKMASYLGMMKCIDDNVGRITNALEDEGVLDNTILIFTADHGDMRGEHSRQNKGIPLEASAKVPFVVRWPAKIAKGKQIDHAWNTTDFLPTFLAIMGVKTAGREEGRDLSDLFVGETEKNIEAPTFIRSTGKPGQSFGWLGAVTPRHKLILSSADKPWLIDLKKDPDELINFIDDKQQQDVVRTLARQLKAYAERTTDPYIGNPKTAAHLERLLAG